MRGMRLSPLHGHESAPDDYCLAPLECITEKYIIFLGKGRLKSVTVNP